MPWRTSYDSSALGGPVEDCCLCVCVSPFGAELAQLASSFPVVPERSFISLMVHPFPFSHFPIMCYFSKGGILPLGVMMLYC